MPLTMYDTANGSFDTVPGDAQAIAPYMDGDFNNIAAARERFGHLFDLNRVVSLTCRAGDADAVDWEPGNTDPDPIAWYRQQRDSGRWRPGFYADLFDMKQTILPRLGMIIQLGKPGPRRPVRIITSHPTQEPHICGPKTCGQFPIDADATQYWWSSVAHSPLDLDKTLIRADAFRPLVDPHYAWYYTVKVDHKEYDEGAIARKYDELRDQPLSKILPNRPELKILRAQCDLLADRVARVALYNDAGHKRLHAEWGVDHRGFRYSGLLHRSQGRRVA